VQNLHVKITEGDNKKRWNAAK